jgi:hypothetical protein
VNLLCRLGLHDWTYPFVNERICWRCGRREVAEETRFIEDDRIVHWAEKEKP